MEGIRSDLRDFFPRGQLQRNRVVVVQQRVVQVVVFIGKLHDRLVKNQTFLNTVATGKMAGGEVADNDLQRDDPHLFNGGFPVVELLNIVCGDPTLRQFFHKIIGHSIVDSTFALDDPFLQTVEGGCVVFVGNDHNIRVIRGIDPFGFPLVELFALLHDGYPLK